MLGDDIILVDPPMKPSLRHAPDILGGVSAILLTATNQGRRARYLAETFGCTVYLPAQSLQTESEALAPHAVAYDGRTPLPGGIYAVRRHIRSPGGNLLPVLISTK